MKKTVKFLSGTALVMAIAFVSLTSFNTPDPVGDDCGCPQGWDLWDYSPKSQGGDGGGLDSENLEQYDVNGDDVLCVKYLYDKGEGKGKGNSKTGWYGKVWKDNNKPCNEGGQD